MKCNVCKYTVFATGLGNMIIPFVVDVYKATCKVRCQTHLFIPCQGVHIWIRLAWNACEATAAFAAEPVDYYDDIESTI